MSQILDTDEEFACLYGMTVIFFLASWLCSLISSQWSLDFFGNLKKRGLPAFHTLELCCLSAGTSELSVTRRTRAWTGKTSEMPAFPRWQPIDETPPKRSLRQHETTVVVISFITACFYFSFRICFIYFLLMNSTHFLSWPDINAPSLSLYLSRQCTHLLDLPSIINVVHFREGFCLNPTQPYYYNK